MNFDLRTLVVIYKEDPDEEDANQTVLGVREFRVAKALMDGQQELLDKMVPSQWGLVHLFDLCLWFGYVDTALALATGGVKGCTLQTYHLGGLPDARDVCPQLSPCQCTGWETCLECCWGFPLHRGIWMKDWNAPLEDAAIAAKRAANTPLVKNILEICGRNEKLPFAMSEESAARLLDIAILCGDVEAAANLAKMCQARPLRRWRADEVLPFSPLDECRMLPVIVAALWAGADFHDLHVWLNEKGLECPVPFLRAAPLYFNEEQWQVAGHFFEQCSQWPSKDTSVGHHFLSVRRCGLSTRRIQNALKAGWDLTCIWTPLGEGRCWHDASLLDLAVLCGQPHCADLLAKAGVELSLDCLHLCRLACDGHGPEMCSPLGVLKLASSWKCKSAAFAAALGFVMKSFKPENVKKAVLPNPVMPRKPNPGHFPAALVHDILSFSMEASKILDQLDLWDDVNDWLPSIQSLSSRFLEAADGEDTSLPMDGDDEGEPTLGYIGQTSAEAGRILW